jgi:MYXO-CTERM domain-containing protein
MATSAFFQTTAPAFVKSSLAVCLALAALAFLPAQASAANILFVTDNGSESVISSILETDGHDVTVRNRDFTFGMNISFHEDLSSYDAIFWIANGDGYGSYPHLDIEAFTNLTDYVENGGRVFVTGFGSVGNTSDTNLVQFLGGTSGTSYTGYPGPVADLDTSLSNGPYDIRGVTPMMYDYQYEGLTGLAADTIAIVTSVGGFGVPGTQWSLRGLGSGEIAFVASGQPYSPGASSYAWSTPGATGAGAFNSALRNFAAASEGSASEPGAPLVRFTSPFAADEGDEITISAEITDEEGDSVTFSWDLDGDGTYGDSPGEADVVIPAGSTDGPTSLRVGVEASDGVHTSQRTRSIRITNVAPDVLSTPPSIAAIGQHIHYHIVVADPAGAADPLTYELISGPPTALVTADGYFDWTPTESEVTAVGTSTPVNVAIDDGDMGHTNHTWDMSVLNDHAPTDPSPQFPTLGVALLDTSPRLVVADSIDIDGDDLTYFFELDRADTFDSEDLQTSGAITEQPVLTEWTPDVALGVGTWHWRVWVSDGTATTVPVAVNFIVVPDPSMIPDAGPSDGGTDAAAPVMDTRPRGCSCTVTSPHERTSPAAGLAVLALGLALVATRRRR